MFKLPDHLIARMGSLGIAESDLIEKFSRSSGAGGQNVNKVSSRVQISYDHPEFGNINVSCQRARDQDKNRIAARERLCERVEAAIENRKLAEAQSAYKERTKRRKPSKKEKEIKRKEKTHQSKKKANRRITSDD
jgi:protein subunit release factor B